MNYTLQHRLELLKDRKNGVGKILEEALNQEDNCLEFKVTAFKPNDGEVPLEYESGARQKDDYTWNVVREIIAFANTSGGIILIGIGVNKSTTALETPTIYMDEKGCDGRKTRVPIDDDEKWDKYILLLESSLLVSSYSTSNPNMKGGSIKYELDFTALQQIKNPISVC